LERPAPGVVAATTAGDGTPTNHKLTANEDSLAVVALESSTTALIADAHFGPTSGEIAARAFARIMLRNPARSPDGLRELLIDLDRVIRAERPAADSSETTAVTRCYNARARHGPGRSHGGALRGRMSGTAAVSSRCPDDPLNG